MLQNELRCAAARCVVLMIEHEWPQNWPELFDQLEDVSFFFIISFPVFRFIAVKFNWKILESLTKYT